MRKKKMTATSEIFENEKFLLHGNVFEFKRPKEC